MANEFIIKNGFYSNGNSAITGSLIVSASGANNDLRIGTNKLFVSASGNVGVGTLTPTTKLEVIGDFKFGPWGGGALTFGTYQYGTDFDMSPITGPGGWARAHRIKTSDPSGSIFFGAQGTGTELIKSFWTIDTSGSLTFNSTTNGIYLLKNGNVGIGTTTPNATLHITNTSTSASFRVEDSTNPDTTPFVIDSSGDVGIGTTTPTAKLDIVYAASAGTGVLIRGGGGVLDSTPLKLWDIGTAVNNRNIIEFAHNSTYVTASRIYSTNPSPNATTGGKLVLETTSDNIGTFNTSQLVLSNNGNVGIGTDTPINTLQIQAAPTASIRLQETGSGGNKRLDLTIDGSGTARISANQSAQQMAFDTVGSERIRITEFGNVGINKTTPNATLDVSGSTIISGSLTVTGGITGSITASGVFGPYGSNSVITSSFAVTASYFNATIQTLGTSIYSTNPPAGPNFNTTGGIYIGEGAGQNATNAYSSSFIGYLAGNVATNAYNSTFIGIEAGQSAANANNSVFIGARAGNGASSANNSTFIGKNAGDGAASANNSVFIGADNGVNATNAANSNFFGQNAGNSATKANASNFFGQNAGTIATNAANSNFFGELAGFFATDASGSNFLGYNAGDTATSASYSNFLGYNAGTRAASASYSNIFGYRAGYTSHVSESIGSNNIIIGTNITLKISQSNAINIGGIIFGTGSYSDVMYNPYSGSVADGRIGIGVVSPRATLDVSGSFHVEGTYKAPSGNTIDSNALIQAGLLYLSNNF